MTAREHIDAGDRLLASDLPSAVRQYEAAIDADPSIVDAYIRLAGIHHVNFRDPVKALELTRKAILLRPGSANLRNSAASLLMCMDRFEEAVDEFHQAISCDSKGGSHFMLGICQMRLNRHADAILSFQTSLTVDRSTATRLFLGDAYQANGQTAEAIEQWQIVAKWKPKDSDSMTFPIQAAKRLDQIDENTIQVDTA